MNYKETISWLQAIDNEYSGWWLGNGPEEELATLFRRDLVERVVDAPEYICLTDLGHDILSAAVEIAERRRNEVDEYNNN